MVEDRQDCFYIADFNRVGASIAEATAQSNSVDSNYVATYYPWVKTLDTNTNKILSVPPSVLMPAVFAANDRLAAEWFAPAGLNRGGITGAISVLNRLTHAERDTLYENKVNPIASFPGQGIVAFGQKTLQDRASALDRINVRRLLIVLKKFIASTSRYLVFEQNTATTRARFLNTVNPYLEAVQQRQGLYAFKVVMDESNNTPDVIDRNILAGQIFLQPAKTAEFIVIDFNILPTGASFSA
jgi:phage tail sheath protein FI